MVVIPMVTILMLMFIVFICVYFIPVLPGFVLSVLIYICHIMIVAVKSISDLPFSVFDNLVFSEIQLFLLLFFPLLILGFIHYRKLSCLKYAFLVIIMVNIEGFIEKNSKNNFNLCIFNIPKTFALDLIINEEHYFVLDNLPDTDLSKIQYYTRNYCLKTHKYPEYISLDSLMNKSTSLSAISIMGQSNYILNIDNKVIAIIGDYTALRKIKSDNCLKIDVLIIFDDKFYRYDKKNSLFNTDKIVVASSSPARSDWNSEVIDSCYFVKEEGAFLMTDF